MFLEVQFIIESKVNVKLAKVICRKTQVGARKVHNTTGEDARKTDIIPETRQIKKNQDSEVRSLRWSFYKYRGIFLLRSESRSALPTPAQCSKQRYQFRGSCGMLTKKHS